jgi:heme exporter protein A
VAAARAIELRGLTRAFGERIALADVTLALDAGATLVVFGPNGAGKTTLLRVLATLLRPTEGDAVVLGSTLPADGHAVRGRVGFLGHEALLYRELSGRENLRYHARLHDVGFGRVDELLARVDMERRADEPIRTLSRGMVQRLAVCRAVLHEPDLLLLDEPRSHLDPAATELVEPLLSGPARVIASHDPAGGLAEADLVLGLRAGRPAFLAAPSEVDAERVGALYR